jgi:hypothetical protein
MGCNKNGFSIVTEVSGAELGLANNSMSWILKTHGVGREFLQGLRKFFGNN